MLRIHSVKSFIAFILIATLLCGIVVAASYGTLYTEYDLSNPQPLNEEAEGHPDIITLKTDPSSTTTHNISIKPEIRSEDTEVIFIDEEDIEEENIEAEDASDNEAEEFSKEVKAEADHEHMIHTVTYYDSWWRIACDYYNNGNLYDELAEYNGCSINSILHVGQEIIIPVLLVDNDAALKATETTLKTDDVMDIEVVEDESGTTTIITTMRAGEATTYQYGVRSNPRVDIVVPTGNVMKNNTDVVDTSNFTYYGCMTTTGYNPTCAHCCGSTAGIGAAGVKIIPGYSVAAPAGIALGTTIYIEGYGFYVVEDRGGFGSNNIDIACPTDDSAQYVTNLSGVNVYIVG